MTARNDDKRKGGKRGWMELTSLDQPTMKPATQKTNTKGRTERTPSKQRKVKNPHHASSLRRRRSRRPSPASRPTPSTSKPTPPTSRLPIPIHRVLPPLPTNPRRSTNPWWSTPMRPRRRPITPLLPRLNRNPQRPNIPTHVQSHTTLTASRSR